MARDEYLRRIANSLEGIERALTRGVLQVNTKEVPVHRTAMQPVKRKPVKLDPKTGKPFESTDKWSKGRDIVMKAAANG